MNVEIAYLNGPETGLSRIDPAISVTNLRRRGKYSFRSLCRLRTLVRLERQAVVAVNMYPLLYVIPAISQKKSVTAIGLVNTTELVGRERYFGHIYGLLLKRCDRIIFGCAAQQSHWVKQFTLAWEASQVIYNGVDCDYFSPNAGIDGGHLLREQHGIPADAVIIGSIGRLASEKSFDLLISAASRLKAVGRRTFLILVGEGPEKDKLKQLAEKYGIGDKVRFLGLQDDVRPALSIMDIFVLPSSAVETFSNAGLEAMAMARAVVLSSMGGAAEMIDHGKNGLVFPVGDIDVLTEFLVMLHDSSDMRQRLGSAARKRVESSFTFRKMVEQYRELLPSA
jgi:glycosyltransferase involved in cell wall biosynthesis